MQEMIILPGSGGSGDAHWQTRWERSDPAFSRFAPRSWDQPALDDWSHALDRALARCVRPPVLVAHSLSCLLVAHWAAGSRGRIAGAFLVAVPDPQGSIFPAEASSFRDVPQAPLPFPSLVIASTDDPYGTLPHARRQAVRWQSGFVIAGALGHINTASGLGDWPQGRALLDAFCAGLAKPSHEAG